MSFLESPTPSSTTKDDPRPGAKSAEPPSSNYPRQQLSVPYSTLSDLNTVDIYQPHPALEAASEDGYWIM